MHYQGDAPHHQQYSNNKWGGPVFIMFKFQMGERGRKAWQCWHSSRLGVRGISFTDYTLSPYPPINVWRVLIVCWMQVALHKDKHPLYLNEKEHFGTGQHYVIVVFFFNLFLVWNIPKIGKKKWLCHIFTFFAKFPPQKIIIVRNFIIKKTLL